MYFLLSNEDLENNYKFNFSFIKNNFVSKDRINKILEDKIKLCNLELLEYMGGNDEHYNYWSMYRNLLIKLRKELLEE